MTLDRQRLQGNFIDQLRDLARRVRRLEERTPEITAFDAGINVAGLKLRLLTTTPELPPDGQLLVYAFDDGAGTVTLRAVDADGTVKTLETWV
jgi:hypothetical protein